MVVYMDPLGEEHCEDADETREAAPILPTGLRAFRFWGLGLGLIGLIGFIGFILFTGFVGFRV